MASSIDTSTDVVLVDTRTSTGSIQLPLTTDIPYRVFTIKDAYGSFGTNSLTVTTQGLETFEDGATTKIFNTNFLSITLYGNTQNAVWQILSSATTTTTSIDASLGISSLSSIEIGRAHV